MTYFTLKISEVIKDVPDVITIKFKQPALRKVKYKAGQYLTLVVRVNGRKYIRPYSFSSAPAVDPYLAITLKRIPGGIVSNYLYDHVKPDDIIEVIEPMGDFIFDAENTEKLNHIMLWGAGTGITPLMSILKTALQSTGSIKVDLFYCNRNPEHTIFFNELNVLQEGYPQNLSIHYFYTRIPEDIYLNYHIAGRIDSENISALLSKYDNLANVQHYICGPVGLKETVKSSLKKLSIPEKNILSEEFEILIDPQEFDDIETRNITITNAAAIDTIVEVIKGKSILDTGLDQLIDLPYSCQTGTCKLCKAKLLRGKIKVVGVAKMPDGLDKDDCLLCCSYPYSEDVKIKIN